jgi:integrase
MWTIPKTKTGVEHRIPLSKQAVELLKQIHTGRKTGTVFTGDKPGKPMSNGAMLAVVKRMTRAGLVEKGAVTPHGMARAGFKSWASEETDAEHGVIEACMSHVIGDKVEAAYRRTDFYAKRAKLMQDWADYVTGVITESGSSGIAGENRGLKARPS